ncbi:putative transcriptional regulator [Cucumis melo var. makuwa]|uniref:Transcriptional regulator n=1 Tax=Cucumis melo var. makuwa TaxID=1194695 RepID=A0A5A7UD69_CUCMM|nr:putative transcriptional regulator [Cucumis melo var. makuwa]
MSKVKGLLALRTIAEAYGGLAALAEAYGISRESLYRMLSKKGFTAGTKSRRSKCIARSMAPPSPSELWSRTRPVINRKMTLLPIERSLGMLILSRSESHLSSKFEEDQGQRKAVYAAVSVPSVPSK